MCATTTSSSTTRISRSTRAASRLAARRATSSASPLWRPARVRGDGRVSMRVVAAGGGLFGALDDVDVAGAIATIKETELELSRAMWRALDAATAAAGDAIDGARSVGFDAARDAASDAASAALAAVPEPLKARVK